MTYKINSTRRTKTQTSKKQKSSDSGENVEFRTPASGPRYSIIPGSAPYDCRLTDFDLRVLCCIGRHTDSGGWCFISQTKLATKLGKSREHLNRSVSKLAKIGYLSKEDRRSVAFGDKRSNICFYRVNMDLVPAPDKVEEAHEIRVFDDLVMPGSQPPCDPTITTLVMSGSQPLCAYDHNTTTLSLTTPINNDHSLSLRSRECAPESGKPLEVVFQEIEKEPAKPSLALVPGEPAKATRVATKRAASDKGTRLPDDWVMPSDWIAWVIETEKLDPDYAQREAVKFSNYWISQPGAKGRKTNWKRTWHNWAMKAPEFAPKIYSRYGSASVPSVTLSRFEEGKIVIDVHGCLVKGEDANDILDAVDGATRDMVRKALKAASGTSQGSLVGYGEKKPSLDAISRWCEEALRREVAIAKHGTPEQLCGGNVAKIGAHELEFTAGAISQAFLDSLKAKYPNAWVTPHERDAWGEQVHYQQPEERLWRAFAQIAEEKGGPYLPGGSRCYNWTAYGPESQAKLEAAFEQAVEAESDLVSAALRRIAEGREQAKNARFDWSQMQYLGSYWHLPPQIKGAVCNAFNIPMDALNRCLRTLEGTLSPASAGRELESMLGGAA